MINFSIPRVLLTLLLLFSFTLSAQYTEQIASGRPGNANGAFSVGKGVYQVQAGYNFSSISLDEDQFADEFAETQEISNTDVIFRIGLKDDFELRIAGNFVSRDQSEFQNNQSFSSSGLERIVLGVRQTLLYQKGVIPSIAMQFSADFGGVEDYQRDAPDAIFRLNFSNQISDKLGVNYNASSRWQTDNSSMQGFFIVSFGYMLLDNFSVTAETFSVVNKQSQSLSGGLGLAYFINQDFLIDVYGSYGKNSLNDIPLDRSVLSLSLGVSYRLANL